jgi:hypothetical protein
MSKDTGATRLEILARRLGHSLLAGTISISKGVVSIDFTGARIDGHNAFDALVEIGEIASQATAKQER